MQFGGVCMLNCNEIAEFTLWSMSNARRDEYGRAFAFSVASEVDTGSAQMSFRRIEFQGFCALGLSKDQVVDRAVSMIRATGGHCSACQVIDMDAVGGLGLVRFVGALRPCEKHELKFNRFNRSKEQGTKRVPNVPRKDRAS